MKDNFGFKHSKKTVLKKPASIAWGTYMRGLGKRIWDGEDAQEYVKKLRADRKF